MFSALFMYICIEVKVRKRPNWRESLCVCVFGCVWGRGGDMGRVEIWVRMGLFIEPFPHVLTKQNGPLWLTYTFVLGLV